jgi:hypothetical protein
MHMSRKLSTTAAAVVAILAVICLAINWWKIVSWLQAFESLAGWVQAFGSIIAIFISVWGATWLQDRERAKVAHGASVRQLVVAESIAEVCIETLKRLNRRATRGELSKNRIRRYLDELDDIERNLGQIDMMNLPSAEVVKAIASLRRLVRAARRRLHYASNAVEDGFPYLKDAYEELLGNAEKAKARLAS